MKRAVGDIEPPAPTEIGHITQVENHTYYELNDVIFI